MAGFKVFQTTLKLFSKKKVHQEENVNLHNFSHIPNVTRHRNGIKQCVRSFVNNLNIYCGWVSLKEITSKQKVLSKCQGNCKFCESQQQIFYYFESSWQFSMVINHKHAINRQSDILRIQTMFKLHCELIATELILICCTSYIHCITMSSQ